MKECKDFKERKEKEKMDKVIQLVISLGYTMGTDDVQKLLNNVDNAYVEENKIKKFNEKICYHAEKIGTVAQLLSMKRLFIEKKYEDILVLCRYILREINKITDIVESEEKKNA